MHTFPVLVLGLTVCFLSLFLDSLPQPFLKCLLPVSFPYFPLLFRFLSSASVSLPATQPSVSLFPFFLILPHSGCLSARIHFRFYVFPVLSCLISYAFLSGSRTRLTDGFLSFFPVSLPQLFHR